MIIFMKKTGFIINVFIMTGSMLIIRMAGIVSNIYISAKAGAEAMGLYHVIFSVYAFAITVSVSGTGLAATRLVSERFGEKNHNQGANIIKKCITIAMLTSVFAAVIMFFGASYISINLIGDKRCISALRILALSLPFIGASAVLRGGFIAMRKAAVITGSQITEEFTAIFITIYILKSSADTPYAYMSMIIGNCASEALAFIYDFIMAKIIFKSNAISAHDVKYKNILNICVPVALGSYLRAGLVALENVLIPKQLGKFGIIHPLSEYGVVKAMAMQIILFPTVFIHSFASMLVPEMSEMNAAMRKNGIKYVAALAIKFTLIFAFAATAVFYKYHHELAQTLYKNENVSFYLGALSLLVVPMYLDTVVDSMLKGLNQQMSNLRYNIADSILRVLAIWILLPRYGMYAYIVLLYASELFNLTLSIGRLIRVSGVRVKIGECIVTPVFCIGISIFAIKLFRFSGFIPEILVFIVIYMLCTFIFNKTED